MRVGAYVTIGRSARGGIVLDPEEEVVSDEEEVPGIPNGWFTSFLRLPTCFQRLPVINYPGVKPSPETKKRKNEKTQVQKHYSIIKSRKTYQFAIHIHTCTRKNFKNTKRPKTSKQHAKPRFLNKNPKPNHKYIQYIKPKHKIKHIQTNPYKNLPIHQEPRS